MKQTLQLKLGQQLTMTPQLQQAIRLLQLSTLELQTEIQEALDSNPMLEVAEDTAGEDNPDARLTEVTPGEVESKAVDNTSQDIPQELSVDSSWEDTFDIPISSNRASDDDNRDYDHNASSEQSLHEYLTWQMQLTPFSDTDRTIATALLDAIDDDGYLSESIEAIYQGLENELGIEVDEVEAVLRQIQNFDPPGVAARDLRESMLLQLQRLDANDPHRLAALSIINQHFELLANRDYANLMRRTKLGEADLQQTVQLIQSLNPRPGNQISTSKTEYIVPDVVVRKVKNRWRAELNLEMTPRLGINRLYAELAQRHNGNDVNYLRNQLQEARWFIKSLKSRNETLLKVAQCIVDQQRGFFDFGEEAMQPLVMADIAQAVGMHESTISRVTTKKYMHSPRGIFELKYFFSSHVSTTGGGEASATAIRAIIKKLISAEKPTKPLSDSKLASLLEEQGIQVARRTVAKYRETMGIAPSNERKRLI